MIDLHAHILPGFDDGVGTEDESVEFARTAVADGIRTLVATPHCKDGFFENGRAGILAGVERLRARLSAESVPLEIVPGAEVHLAPDLPARVRDGRAPTLADNGRTLLLELSLSQYPVDLENLVFRLRLAGVLTVFAHPERIRYFQEDVRRYEAVVRLGAFGQITAGRDRRLVAGPHTCVGPATGQAHTDQEFRIFRADSSLTSETCGMPVSRAVSRLPEKMSLRLISFSENFRTPAISCCTPQASLSARV